MTFLKLSAFLTSLVVVAGCTGSTNPETATLFDNINNLKTGEYDRQIAANRAEADAILRNNAASQSRISSLEGQRSANLQELASLKNQISALKQTAAMTRASAAGNPAKLAKVSALEGQLTALSAEVNSGSADISTSRAELSRIRAALNAL